MMPLRSLANLVSGLVVAAVAAVAAAGCGSEIGDTCFVSSDCDINGGRQCDNTSDAEGYCTIVGCDHDTCPEEAVCVRFFAGTFSNRPCDHATEDIATNMCSPDELCALEGYCAPRSAESRYCMRRCDGSDDCRSRYECRDLELMRAHGGEPVSPPGERLGDSPPRFCALRPS